jgi:membrane protease YdiL (CAAX protease family)
VIAGVLAAVPVWLALALGAGGRLRAADTLAAWMSLVVVQPLVEEIAMRGVLQGRLLERAGAHRVGPFSVANLATSACFVALHLPAQPVAWALSTAVPSLLLGHLRERLGSVWPAVALHALYNAGFGLAALAARA